MIVFLVLLGALWCRVIWWRITAEPRATMLPPRIRSWATSSPICTVPPYTLPDDRELHANSSHRRASRCSLHFHSASDSLLSRLTADDTREIRSQTGIFMSPFAAESRYGDSTTVLCVYLAIQCELALPMVRSGLSAQLPRWPSSDRPEAEW